VVAEFVEEQEQKEILQELGCELFQGYLFSKPYHLEKYWNISKRVIM
jgi:EAL domain-containing protein (putative c-di-GMP-specific phosphodiesterase class I)